MFRDKGFVIGIVITLLLIAGGIFLMSGGSKTPSSSGSEVSMDILVPKGDYETSGIENGNYLPASSSAKLTLVEFGDYECPACGLYNPFVKQLLGEFVGKITYVFRNYPLPQHANAPISSQAAETAGLQGKFWQMHDKLYETQSEWSTSTDAKSIFIGYAESMGLDVNKFKTDIDSKEIKDKVQNDTNDGNLIKLSETPTFYLNGVKIGNLAGSYDDLKNAINAALSKN
jgi:protein-disulfide isomerase